jgi:hypothetical protein
MIRLVLALPLAGVMACNPAEPSPDEATILDPTACASCHPAHVAQWSQSTHATASTDPIFRAMNARYLRETGNTEPGFCVGCHAPVAVLLGATEDGSELSSVPDHLQGVTCAWCHRVEDVQADHNGSLRVARDTTMRGGIADPEPTDAHVSAWSALLDRDSPAASDTCGACHDVVLPSGLHVERTYLEWHESVFNAEGPSRLGCGHCHMPSSTGPAATAGPARTLHDHGMPAVGISHAPGVDIDQQTAAVQAALDPTVGAVLCVSPVSAGAEITLILENVAAGHGFPTGAAKHRRVWAEVVAWADDAEVLRLGTVADDVALSAVPDPRRWELHEQTTDTDGDPAEMLWDIAALTSRALPVPVTRDPRDPDFNHSLRETWRLSGVVPDRVEARIHVRTLGLDVLDSLVESGDLDPEEAWSKTLTLAGSDLVWTGPFGTCTD